MASRPAPVGTVSAQRQAQPGGNIPASHQIAAGHAGLHQPLAEGMLRLDLLDLLTGPPVTDEGDAGGERPSITSSDTVRTDDGATTTVTFDDGSTLVVERVRAADSLSTTSTRTDADGTVTTSAKTITHLSDTSLQTVQVDANGTTTTTVDLNSGTRTLDRVEADGDHVTLIQTRGIDGLTGQYTLVQADGDSGTLDYSLIIKEGGSQTLSVEGTTADGVVVDSTVVVDLDTRLVTVTDHQGDIATFSLLGFQDQVLDTGLIGVIADVDTGYFG